MADLLHRDTVVVGGDDTSGMSEQVNRHTGRGYRILIGLISMFALFYVINIVVKREFGTENIPVIYAEGMPMWVRPEEHGGVSAKFTGFALNRLIGGQLESNVQRTVKLAPRQHSLPADAISPRDLRVIQRGEIETAKTVKVQDEAVGTEADPGATTAIPNTETIDLDEAITNLMNSTSFVEERYLGSEVNPSTVPSGTFVAQFGNYSERLQAVNRMIELRSSYPEYLGENDWIIELFNLANRRSYRLRMLGFKDFASTRTFCQNLTSRGVKCIPTTVF